MAEEKKEPWLNYLALSTVILAVCATLATFKAGNYSTRSVMSQTRAANEWSYYQSKSVKGYLHELQKDAMSLQLMAAQNGRAAAPVIAAYEQMIASYDKKLAKYEEEKAGIEKGAREQERIREDSQKHSQIFGMAVIFLQIAILLSSISALLKKKPVWILSMAVGIVGLVYFANGFFLFFKLS
jgi:hypothetical protein